MSVKNSYLLVYSCLLALLIFLTLNRHSKSDAFTYHSEIWADKAGYYVYLPSAFLYDFKASQFPDSVDIKTGNGFTLNQETDVVETKYSYGVALMQLPFFLLANVLAPSFDQKQDGFSMIHHRSIDIAAAFYMLLGALFLQLSLRRRYGETASVLCVLTLFAGTNLYYYAIDETGMSHVYSFALFAFLIWLVEKPDFLNRITLTRLTIIGIVSALIVLIRPTNLIFLLFLLLFKYSVVMNVLEGMKPSKKLRYFFTLLLTFLIVFIPQFIYRQYVSGSAMDYSYGNESFNWFAPELAKIWFSPFNGLFLYTPLFFIILLAIVSMMRSNFRSGLLFAGLFLLLSYVFSSWWSWHFGCAFGSRSFVEYYAVFAFPLANFYKEVRTWKTWKTYLLAIVVIAFVAFNLKLTYSYDGCFYWEQDWDWDAYLRLIVAPTK